MKTSLISEFQDIFDVIDDKMEEPYTVEGNPSLQHSLDYAVLQVFKIVTKFYKREGFFKDGSSELLPARKFAVLTLRSFRQDLHREYCLAHKVPSRHEVVYPVLDLILERMLSTVKLMNTLEVAIQGTKRYHRTYEELQRRKIIK